MCTEAWEGGRWRGCLLETRGFVQRKCPELYPSGGNRFVCITQNHRKSCLLAACFYNISIKGFQNALISLCGVISVLRNSGLPKILSSKGAEFNFLTQSQEMLHFAFCFLPVLWAGCGIYLHRAGRRGVTASLHRSQRKS